MAWLNFSPRGQNKWDAASLNYGNKSNHLAASAASSMFLNDMREVRGGETDGKF
jgi:hypothetical protein